MNHASGQWQRCASQTGDPLNVTSKRLVRELTIASGAYGAAAFLLLRFSQSSQGLLYSGDGSPAVSSLAARQAIQNIWQPFQVFGSGTIGGSLAPEQAGWFLVFVVNIPVAAGLEPALAQRLTYALTTIIAGLSMHLLLRLVGIPLPLALSGGIFFAFGAATFTLLNMGWIYLLLTLAVTPALIAITYLALARANVIQLMTIGLVSGLVVFATSAMPALVVMMVVVTIHWVFWPNETAFTKATPNATILKRSMRALLLWICFPLLHTFWILPRLVSPVPPPTTPLSQSLESLATSSGLSSTSALTMLGTTFNDSFGRLLNGQQSALLVCLGLFALGAILIPWHFSLPRTPFLVMLIFFVLLSLIPASLSIATLDRAGLGRDVGRLVLFSSVPLVVLFVCFVAWASQRIGAKDVIAAGFVLAVVVISAGPYWKPGIEIGNYQPACSDPVQLLKPLPIDSSQYEKVGQLLLTEREHWAVAAIPARVLIAPIQDPRFCRPYQTMTNPLGLLGVPSLYPGQTSKSTIEVDSFALSPPPPEAVLGREHQMVEEYSLVMRQVGAKYVALSPALFDDNDEWWIRELLSRRGPSGEPPLFREVDLPFPTSSYGVQLIELIDSRPSLKIIVGEGSTKRQVDAHFITENGSSSVFAAALDLDQSGAPLLIDAPILAKSPAQIRAAVTALPSDCITRLASGDFAEPPGDMDSACLDQVTSHLRSADSFKLDLMQVAPERRTSSDETASWSLQVEGLLPLLSDQSAIVIELKSPTNDLQAILFRITLLGLMATLIVASIITVLRPGWRPQPVDQDRVP